MLEWLKSNKTKSSADKQPPDNDTDAEKRALQEARKAELAEKIAKLQKFEAARAEKAGIGPEHEAARAADAKLRAAYEDFYKMHSWAGRQIAKVDSVFDREDDDTSDPNHALLKIKQLEQVARKARIAETNAAIASAEIRFAEWAEKKEATRAGGSRRLKSHPDEGVRSAVLRGDHDIDYTDPDYNDRLMRRYRGIIRATNLGVRPAELKVEARREALDAKGKNAVERALAWAGGGIVKGAVGAYKGVEKGVETALIKKYTSEFIKKGEDKETAKKKGEAKARKMLPSTMKGIRLVTTAAAATAVFGSIGVLGHVGSAVFRLGRAALGGVVGASAAKYAGKKYEKHAKELQYDMESAGRSQFQFDEEMLAEFEKLYKKGNAKARATKKSLVEMGTAILTGGGVAAGSSLGLVGFESLASVHEANVSVGEHVDRAAAAKTPDVPKLSHTDRAPRIPKLGAYSDLSDKLHVDQTTGQQLHINNPDALHPSEHEIDQMTGKAKAGAGAIWGDHRYIGIKVDHNPGAFSPTEAPPAAGAPALNIDEVLHNAPTDPNQFHLNKPSGFAAPTDKALDQMLGKIPVHVPGAAATVVDHNPGAFSNADTSVAPKGVDLSHAQAIPKAEVARVVPPVSPETPAPTPETAPASTPDHAGAAAAPAAETKVPTGASPDAKPKAAVPANAEATPGAKPVAPVNSDAPPTTKPPAPVSTETAPGAKAPVPAHTDAAPTAKPVAPAEARLGQTNAAPTGEPAKPSAAATETAPKSDARAPEGKTATGVTPETKAAATTNASPIENSKPGSVADSAKSAAHEVPKSAAATADTAKAGSPATPEATPVAAVPNPEVLVSTPGAHDGQGAIRLVEHLKAAMKGNTEVQSEAIKKLSEMDPTKLAIALKLYVPGAEHGLENMKIPLGSTLEVSKTGELVLHLKGSDPLIVMHADGTIPEHPEGFDHYIARGTHAPVAPEAHQAGAHVLTQEEQTAKIVEWHAAHPGENIRLDVDPTTGVVKPHVEGGVPAGAAAAPEVLTRGAAGGAQTAPVGGAAEAVARGGPSASAAGATAEAMAATKPPVSINALAADKLAAVSNTESLHASAGSAPDTAEYPDGSFTIDGHTFDPQVESGVFTDAKGNVFVHGGDFALRHQLALDYAKLHPLKAVLYAGKPIEIGGVYHSWIASAAADANGHVIDPPQPGSSDALDKAINQKMLTHQLPRR